MMTVNHVYCVIDIGDFYVPYTVCICRTKKIAERKRLEYLRDCEYRENDVSISKETIINE